MTIQIMIQHGEIKSQAIMVYFNKLNLNVIILTDIILKN